LSAWKWRYASAPVAAVEQRGGLANDVMWQFCHSFRIFDMNLVT